MTPYVVSKAIHRSDSAVGAFLSKEGFSNGAGRVDYDDELLAAASRGDVDTCLELLEAPFPFDCLTEVALVCLEGPERCLGVLRSIVARPKDSMDDGVDFEKLLEYVDTSRESSADVITLLTKA